MKLRTGLLVGLLALGACVPKRQPPPPAPRPQAQPQPRPQPAPLPPPPLARDDWRDLPLTPGNWSYGSGASGSRAAFGTTGAAPLLLVRCERAARTVSLALAGDGGRAMTIRTSAGARSLGLQRDAADPAYTSAILAANDRLLDEMVFSRGRFTVERAGGTTLVIPTWPEPARVIEDCRG